MFLYFSFTKILKTVKYQIRPSTSHPSTPRPHPTPNHPPSSSTPSPTQNCICPLRCCLALTPPPTPPHHFFFIFLTSLSSLPSFSSYLSSFFHLFIMFSLSSSFYHPCLSSLSSFYHLHHFLSPQAPTQPSLTHPASVKPLVPAPAPAQCPAEPQSHL